MWTYPPRSILVAVDFGTASVRALRVAHALARTHGSALTALHAETIEVPPYFTHDQLAEVERHRADARHDAQRYLDTFVQESAPGASSRLVDGPAAAAILAAAPSYDLIVIGTHGRKGPSRWWAGSVAERVVRDTPVPVVVVRAEKTPTEPERVFTHPVAVAGPEFHGESHAYAAGLAAAFGGHVGEAVVSSLQDLACSPDATLMAVSVGRHHGGGWFGDIAERIVRQCELPMLFVPNRT